MVFYADSIRERKLVAILALVAAVAIITIGLVK